MLGKIYEYSSHSQIVKRLQLQPNLFTDEKCSKCIPDCSNTIYDPMITAVPFRQCDETNLGVSPLCNIDKTKLPNPKKFTYQVYDLTFEAI